MSGFDVEHTKTSGYHIVTSVLLGVNVQFCPLIADLSMTR